MELNVRKEACEAFGVHLQNNQIFQTSICVPCLPAPKSCGTSAWLDRLNPARSTQIYREPPLRCPRKSPSLSQQPATCVREGSLNSWRGVGKFPELFPARSESTCPPKPEQQVFQVRKSGRRRHFVFPELNQGLKSRKHRKVNKKLTTKTRLQPQNALLCHVDLSADTPKRKHAAPRTRKKSRRRWKFRKFLITHHLPQTGPSDFIRTPLVIITLIKPTGINVCECYALSKPSPKLQETKEQIIFC